MHSFFKLATGIVGVAATLGVATAQVSISSQCSGALAGLLTDSGAQCLNPTGLLSLLGTGSNSSLIQPLDSWAQGVCKASTCTNATLATIATDLTTSCQTEITSLGFGNVSSTELTSLVQELYPSVREMLCLQDTSNNTLCPTEFLTNLQMVTGTLTLTNLETFLSQVISSSVPNIPKSVECTDCTKQWYNIIQQGFPGVVNSDAQLNVNDTCGSDFVNGQTPSDVKAFGTSSNGTSDDTANAAAAVHADSRLAVLAVVVLSPLLAFLA